MYMYIHIYMYYIYIGVLAKRLTSIRYALQLRYAVFVLNLRCIHVTLKWGGAHLYTEPSTHLLSVANQRSLFVGWSLRITCLYLQ